MNTSNREGWPPTHGGQTSASGQANNDGQSQASRPIGAYGSSNLPPQQQVQQTTPASNTGPVLPPPSGSFFSSTAQTPHSLPTLAGLAQSSHAPPAGPPRQQPPDSSGPPQSHTQPPHSGAGFSLPGVGQAMHQQHHLQPHQSIEQDREREMREREAREAAIDNELAARRDAEQRDREMRERQHHREQQHPPPHETHAGTIHLHQPVAVAPGVRSIHGPNGLLGSAAPGGAPNPIQAQLGGSQALFPAQGIHQGEGARLQQPGQPTPQQLMIPFPAGAGQQAAAGMNQAQQPILNDALSYLDQVKVQFADHPDVYNRFLDIMKDFKGGVIDTPGVIDRVSHLFAGNPGLIQGFNTFLPPGYKIECGAGDDPNSIRVTTPMGSTMSRIPTGRPFSNPRDHPPVNGNLRAADQPFFDGPGRMAWQNQQQPGSQEGPFGPDGRVVQAYAAQNAPSSSTLSPEMQRSEPVPSIALQQDQRGLAHLQNAGAAIPNLPLAGRPGMASTPNEANAAAQQAINGSGAQLQQLGNGGLEKRGPVEFNHAISYVNKIKNRFASHPDIYKQFLEILQTYQRESKPIQDVYAQVTRLFETAPDLLEDFKQFLPESAAHAKAAGARAAGEDAFPLSSTRTDPAYTAAVLQHAHAHQTPRNEQPRLPPMGNFAPTPSANRDNKRKRGEKQANLAGLVPAMQPEAPPVRALAGPNNAVNKRVKHAHAVKPPAIPEHPPPSPVLVPSVPMPMHPAHAAAPTADDLNFFDRVRKHLNNKSQYSEFLKLMNLYTQDLCAPNWLVFRAQAFIGNNPELFKWFKNFIGAEPEDEVIEQAPHPPTGKVALSNCRGLGPSYRLLPKVEQNQICSGRDDLCMEVLNDEWVSHPTWASEDSGFVAHRKNQYEEGLHRIEEERHDYDTHIGVADRTIQLLEPVAQQLATMTPEARAHFELPSTLGGQSEAIPKRAIYKIYGRERGLEVIQALCKKPYDVLPTLLDRLRQKREEWRGAQREWNKLWRQQVGNLFWRSLDHQGAGSKQDKRQFTTKALQQEILVREEEQRRVREITLKASPPFLLQMAFEDEGVLYDCCTLMITWIEHNPAAADNPRITNFVKDFVGTFFGLNMDNVRTTFGSESDRDSGAGAESDNGEEGEASRQKPRNRKTGGLLREVLARGRNGRSTRREAEDSVASDSRASTPEPQSGVDEDIVNAGTPPADDPPPNKRSDKTWVDISAGPSNGESAQADEEYFRTMYNMYNNWNTYCFFRLFSLLYERLLKIKNWESFVHNQVDRELVQKPATRIGWIDKTPGDFFAKTGPDANYYEQMLLKFEDQVNNTASELGLIEAEETLRHFYLFFGPQLYHCDKLVSNLMKHAVSIVTNETRDNSWGIWQAFKKDRQRDTTSHKEEIAYRKRVEGLCRDQDVIRISFDTETKVALIKILRKGDATFQGVTTTPMERWQAYVAALGQIEATEGVDYTHDKFRVPVLRRNLPDTTASLKDTPAGGDLDDIFSDESLKIRVDFATCRLDFQPSDSAAAASMFLRTSRPSEEQALNLRVELARRAEAAREMFVTNNAWVAATPRDEVDAMIDEFARAVAEDDVDEDDMMRFDTEALQGWANPPAVELRVVPQPDDAMDED